MCTLTINIENIVMIVSLLTVCGRIAIIQFFIDTNFYAVVVLVKRIRI